VNAVLRGISRKRASLPLPPRPIDHADRNAALEYLSVTLSHPRWLAARWYDRMGFTAAEAWELFNNAPAPLTLRGNTLRIARQELPRLLADKGITVRAGAFAPDAFVVEEGQPL